MNTKKLTSEALAGSSKGSSRKDIKATNTQKNKSNMKGVIEKNTPVTKRSCLRKRPEERKRLATLSKAKSGSLSEKQTKERAVVKTSTLKKTGVSGRGCARANIRQKVKPELTGSKGLNKSEPRRPILTRSKAKLNLFAKDKPESTPLQGPSKRRTLEKTSSASSIEVINKEVSDESQSNVTTKLEFQIKSEEMVSDIKAKLHEEMDQVNLPATSSSMKIKDFIDEESGWQMFKKHQIEVRKITEIKRRASLNDLPEEVKTPESKMNLNTIARQIMAEPGGLDNIEEEGEDLASNDFFYDEDTVDLSDLYGKTSRFVMKDHTSGSSGYSPVQTSYSLISSFTEYGSSVGTPTAEVEETSPGASQDATYVPFPLTYTQFCRELIMKKKHEMMAKPGLPNKRKPSGRALKKFWTMGDLDQF
ncbi:uncharacterized protein LOC126748711 [Anthonomus grandis grandis]|uniref:uncharacterized protein LOC126748711 n=1 Tax=Anthonomus grandis grandis TaxID=2921223 RepID=UPI0021669D4E|nr:uncharacterized protein LOC126748711 [Anthonomus grandis grandis]